MNTPSPFGHSPFAGGENSSLKCNSKPPRPRLSGAGSSGTPLRRDINKKQSR